MAVCFHSKPVVHMSLVLESFDSTLYDYLHESNRILTIDGATNTVHQIASATQYLHGCGYVHSNISSHNVLVKHKPWVAKLASFELATKVDCSAIKAEIREAYPRRSIAKIKDPYATLPAEYLVYYQHYRRSLSTISSLAPELVEKNKLFVYPTPQTDVFLLSLLLWECLNHEIPFKEWTLRHMQEMAKHRELFLPLWQSNRCRIFEDLFSTGLSAIPRKRPQGVEEFKDMLENVMLEFELSNKREELDEFDFDAFDDWEFRHDDAESVTSADSDLSDFSDYEDRDDVSIISSIAQEDCFHVDEDLDAPSLTLSLPGMNRQLSSSFKRGKSRCHTQLPFIALKRPVPPDCDATEVKEKLNSVIDRRQYNYFEEKGSLNSSYNTGNNESLHSLICDNSDHSSYLEDYMSEASQRQENENCSNNVGINNSRIITSSIGSVRNTIAMFENVIMRRR